MKEHEICLSLLMKLGDLGCLQYSTRWLNTNEIYNRGLDILMTMGLVQVESDVCFEDPMYDISLTTAGKDTIEFMYDDDQVHTALSCVKGHRSDYVLFYPPDDELQALTLLGYVEKQQGIYGYSVTKEGFKFLNNNSNEETEMKINDIAAAANIVEGVVAVGVTFMSSNAGRVDTYTYLAMGSDGIEEGHLVAVPSNSGVSVAEVQWVKSVTDAIEISSKKKYKFIVGRVDMSQYEERQTALEKVAAMVKQKRKAVENESIMERLGFKSKVTLALGLEKEDAE